MTILVAAAAYSQCGGKNGIPRLSEDRNSETSKSLDSGQFRVWHLINDCQQWEFWRRVRVGILEKSQRKSGNSGGDLE